MNLQDRDHPSALSTLPFQRRDVLHAGTEGNALLDEIGPAGRKRLASHLELRKLNQGDILFVPGVMNPYVYFPEDAVISHIYESEGGTSVETALIGSEGASGLCSIFDQRPPEHRASVTVSGYAVRIRVPELKREMEADPTMQSRFVTYLAAHVAELGQRVSCNVFHSAEARLCTWLLMIKDRSRRSDIRITHDEISGLLGLNRTSVSCIAKRLKDSGSVDYARGKFRICDPALLAASACECYSNHAGARQRVSAGSYI